MLRQSPVIKLNEKTDFLQMLKIAGHLGDHPFDFRKAGLVINLFHMHSQTEYREMTHMEDGVMI